ncbi:unnamed protein product [Durusdinium trenchii]|uniref:Uncharacterized protein n=1 Tax=Durusdinium trenchii TaxID=1381693 RepID=A0ABP0IUL8_9DINO
MSWKYFVIFLDLLEFCILAGDERALCRKCLVLEGAHRSCLGDRCCDSDRHCCALKVSEEAKKRLQAWADVPSLLRDLSTVGNISWYGFLSNLGSVFVRQALRALLVSEGPDPRSAWPCFTT